MGNDDIAGEELSDVTDGATEDTAASIATETLAAVDNAAAVLAVEAVGILEALGRVEVVRTAGLGR